MNDIVSRDAKPTLSPETLELAPLDRLRALRDWLRDGELPPDGGWEYACWFETEEKGEVRLREHYGCGTVACAGGWYQALTGLPPDGRGGFAAPSLDILAVHFGITMHEANAVFFGTGSAVDKFMRDVTREDVAAAIDEVLAAHDD